VGVHSPRWQDVAETVSLAIATIDLHKAEISLDLRQVQVFADPLLEKVFYNLVENSLRHGERVTKIRLSAVENADGMDLVIEDNGSGVPENAKEKIFRREYFKNTRFVIHAKKGMFRIGSGNITG
jgi:K+-sensing histidine kinase KdpD